MYRTHISSQERTLNCTIVEKSSSSNFYDPKWPVMLSLDGKISVTALDLAHVTLIRSKELKSVPVRSLEGLKQLMWSLHCRTTLSKRFSPQELRGEKIKKQKVSERGDCTGELPKRLQLKQSAVLFADRTKKGRRKSQGYLVKCFSDYSTEFQLAWSSHIRLDQDVLKFQSSPSHYREQ